MVSTEPVKPGIVPVSSDSQLDPQPSDSLDLPCEAPEKQKPTDAEVLKRIRDLPPDIAVLLISVGCLGFVLPGIVGAPALVAGGLVLWPSKFSGIDSWLEKRFPKVHHKSMEQLSRFLDDLEQRYPSKKRS